MRVLCLVHSLQMLVAVPRMKVYIQVHDQYTYASFLPLHYYFVRFDCTRILLLWDLKLPEMDLD